MTRAETGPCPPCSSRQQHHRLSICSAHVHTQIPLFVYIGCLTCKHHALIILSMCQHVTTCHFCEAANTVVAHVILDMYTRRTSWNHYRHWNMPAPGTFDNPPCAHVHQHGWNYNQAFHHTCSPSSGTQAAPSGTPFWLTYRQCVQKCSPGDSVRHLKWGPMCGPLQCVHNWYFEPRCASGCGKHSIAVLQSHECHTEQVDTDICHQPPHEITWTPEICVDHLPPL